MSKADEMFKEIGYEKKEYSNGYVFYYQYNGIQEQFGFEFSLRDKEIYPVCHTKRDNDEAIQITMQELQAINKKCQELRLDMKQWKEIKGYERAIYNK